MTWGTFSIKIIVFENNNKKKNFDLWPRISVVAPMGVMGTFDNLILMINLKSVRKFCYFNCPNCQIITIFSRSDGSSRMTINTAHTYLRYPSMTRYSFNECFIITVISYVIFNLVNINVGFFWRKKACQHLSTYCCLQLNLIGCN